MPVQITENTPVAEVIKQRPALVQLAQKVFGRSGSQTVRAFSQHKSDVLGQLIELKREGVFDYGQTIRESDNGTWAFPNADDVQKFLDKLTSGSAGPSDMSLLGMDSKAFELVCGEPPAQHDTSTNGVAEETSDESGEVQEMTEEPAPAPATRGRGKATPKAPSGASLSAKEIREVLEEYNLGPQITALQTQLAGVSGDLSAGLFGVVGLITTLAANVKVTHNNLKSIAGYLDPYLELEDLKDFPPEIETLLGRITPSEIPTPLEAQDTNESSEQSEEDGEDEVDPTPPPTKPRGRTTAPKPAAAQASSASPPSGGTVTVDEKALAAMELPELREFAASVGVEPRKLNTAYKGVLIRYIKQAAEQAAS